MSYREALRLLELEDGYSEKELKKKYYPLVKANHPDQVKDAEEKMKKINLAYSILLNELNKRKFSKFREEFLKNIQALKEKYSDTLIYGKCLQYERILNQIDNYKDIVDLKEKFDQDIKELKSKIIVPSEKRRITLEYSKYLKGYSNEIKNLVSEFLSDLNTSETLENINTLLQRFKSRLKNELSLEKKRISEYENIKDSLKKKLLYNFVTNAKYHDYDSLVETHKLLISILELVNLSDVSNIRDVTIVVENEDFRDQVNMRKYSKSSFQLSDLLRIKNNSKTTDNRVLNEVLLSDQLINIILDKYYLYGTKKNTSIEKIIADQESFETLILKIKNLNDRKKERIYNFIKDEGYKSINVIIDAIEDFLDIRKLYIDRDTGGICVLKKSGKKIYTVYLHDGVKQEITSEKDIVWKYLSFFKFFEYANYSNGYEIEEYDFDNNISLLADYNTNYLYYTNEIMLCLRDDEGTLKFEFIPSLRGNKFRVNGNEQITRNDYFKKYASRDICLMDLMLYINGKNFKEIEEKNFSK